MLYVRYLQSIKAKPIHKRQTHPVVERMLHKDCDRNGSVARKSLVVKIKELGTKIN
jgi:hypothetical protein